MADTIVVPPDYSTAPQSSPFNMQEFNQKYGTTMNVKPENAMMNSSGSIARATDISQQHTITIGYPQITTGLLIVLVIMGALILIRLRRV